VLKVLGTLARVVFGFVLASIAAGLVTVLFVNTPSEVLAQPVTRLSRTAGETFELALLTATHAAIFGLVFTLIAAGLGEIFSIRRLPFYLLCGVVIALLGFAAQYVSEVPGEPTVFNNYALKAFLTTGFFAGFVYWLAAGQFAGRAPAGPTLEPNSGAHSEANSSRSASSMRDETTTATAPRTSTAIETPRPVHRTILNRLTFRGTADAAQAQPGEPHETADNSKRTPPTE
jgi:hypothetical protein